MPDSTGAPRFPTTNWATLEHAREGDDLALSRLAEQYWQPVYAYLRTKGHPPADASDLTQAFFAEVVLGRDLAGKADEHRGRFRSFLLTALGNFRIDKHRRGRAVRERTVPMPPNPEAMTSSGNGWDGDPIASFERLWAAALLNQALIRTREYLTSQGYDAHWVVLEERLILPTLHGTEPTPIAELAERLGVDTEKVQRLQYAARRRFQSTLRRVIADTVQDNAEVDNELEHLRTYLEH